eukprot:800094-Rhodomonas_salina.1
MKKTTARTHVDGPNSPARTSHATSIHIRCSSRYAPGSSTRHVDTQGLSDPADPRLWTLDPRP